MNSEAVGNKIQRLSQAEKRKRKSGIRKVGIFFYKYRFLHLLALPGLIYFVIFRYLPMYGVIIAFKDYLGLGGVKGFFDAQWVGFKNFQYLFSGIYFWRLLRNTVLLSSYRLIFGFPAPIILAILMNELRNQRFKKITQTITYIPYFISWVVVSGLIIMLFATNGPINSLISLLGLQFKITLIDSRIFRSILVFSGIWKEAGWGTIIYLAALSGIPIEQYESAFIEGATRWQRTIYITIPNILFAVIILLILRVGGMMNENFNQIMNLYSAPVYDVSDVFETYVYRRGIVQSDFSYASAVGLFQSGVGFLLVIGANKLVKLLGKEGIW